MSYARWTPLATAVFLFASTAAGQGYSVVPGGGGPAASTAQPGTISVMSNTQDNAATRPGQTTVLNGAGRRRPEDYAGLSPGRPGITPGLRRLMRLRGARSPVVAWPGFQMIPGGSRVFLAMSGPVTVTESRPAPNTRVLHLENTRVLVYNNRRPLVTAAFDTPLVQATVRPGRRGSDLVLSLRSEVPTTTRQEPGNDGLTWLYVDLPPYALGEVARIQLPGGGTITVGGPPAVTPVPTPAPPPSQPVPVRAVQETERPPGVN